MAGERLINMMNSRGGNDSDYSDVVFGTVVGESPLKIQMSNQMILDDQFLILGQNVSKYKVKVTYKDYKESSDSSRTEEVTVDNSLKNGDGVTMIRMDGGQQFYVLEKFGGE